MKGLLTLMDPSHEEVTHINGVTYTTGIHHTKRVLYTMGVTHIKRVNHTKGVIHMKGSLTHKVGPSLYGGHSHEGSLTQRVPHINGVTYNRGSS